MPSSERTITINRPVDQVFRFFSTPANDPSWRPHVKEISGTAGPGARIHQVISGPGGRGIPADIEVTTFEPPTRYAFAVVAGPARPIGEFVLTPVGEAATEVRFSLRAELGGFKKLVMGGQVQKSMDGEMQSLDRAKSILEGD